MARPTLSVAQSESLDGLRGFAAVIVVASHAGNMGLNLIPGVSLTGIGKYGVYLFFVLSAFLLSAQWLQAWAGGKVTRSDLTHYLLRRCLRIYPLYTLVLLLGLALAPRGIGVHLDAAAVWRHLTLQEGRDIYWSIPVEFLYYLCLPVLTFWLTRRLSIGVRVFGLLALLAILQVSYPAAAAGLNSTNLLYYLPIFIAGSVAAWFMQGRVAAGEPELPSRGFSLDLAILLLLAATVPSVFMSLGFAQGLDALHRQFIGWGLLWSLLLVGMLCGRLRWWAKVLRQPAWRACGRWCFGIYLLHMPALLLIKRLPLPGVVNAWLGLALALALAAMAYRWIERPAMRAFATRR